MIIVKSKITGKYLRQRSGSFNKQWMRCFYHKDAPRQKLNPYTPSQYTPEERKEMIKFIHGKLFDAEPLEARRYHSMGSCLSSVGSYRDGKTHWPENMEAFEIVAGNLCIIEPGTAGDCKEA